MRIRPFSLLFALALAGAGAADATTVRYNIATEPETLDPTMATGIPEATVILNCFEGLTRVNPDTGEVQPRAAERWDISPDGLTYTFHLRNAVWSDGRPLTAGDFVYAYRRMLDPAQGAE